VQAFHIGYRNTQGTLMRILNAASRRGLDLPAVQAEPAEKDHRVTLVLAVNSKQAGQLCREWYSIADVIHVRSSASREHVTGWASGYPPASAGMTHDEARAARA
jgi:acetolactate synthase small subunit